MKEMMNIRKNDSFRTWRQQVRSCVIVVIIILSSIILIRSLSSSTLNTHWFTAYAAYTRATPVTGGPSVNDPKLKVEVVTKGLDTYQYGFFGTK